MNICFTAYDTFSAKAFPGHPMSLDLTSKLLQPIHNDLPSGCLHLTTQHWLTSDGTRKRTKANTWGLF